MLIMKDPVSNTWDPLDSDLRRRMSARPFVSMTLERKLSLPSEPEKLSNFIEKFASSETASNGEEAGSLESGNVRYERAIHYIVQQGAGSGHHASERVIGTSSMPTLPESLLPLIQSQAKGNQETRAIPTTRTRAPQIWQSHQSSTPACPAPFPPKKSEHPSI